MGILSDPDYGSAKWVKVIRKVHKPLCALCYIGGIIWFLVLGSNEFNNETYFSENALLPGLVTNEFNGEHSANQFFREFLEELQDKYSDTDEMPVPWLVGKMSQLNLEVYTHNFTLNFPLGKNQVFKGTNVYGILRAPRTSSLEAVVVSAPYRSINSFHKGTAAGIALMLAFAQFARPQKYWAKDLIFLVTDHEQLGMQAWLEAYHGIKSDTETFYTSLGSFWKPETQSTDFKRIFDVLQGGSKHEKCLNPGRLDGRSGSIQAAINLEFDTPKIKYVEVKVEGLNGQLPNLDLVNLVNKLCLKSGIHHSFKNSYSWIRRRSKVDEWAGNVWTMLGMVATQIPGVPNGNHGLFHHFGIEAVTLEGRGVGDPAGSPPRVATLSAANFYRLGIALESILRSVNNLLERFHQSFFFYLLASTNRFISIAFYMPSLAVMCGAMLVKALAIWVSIYNEEDMQTDKKTHKRKNYDAHAPSEEESGEEVKKSHKRKLSDPDVLEKEKEVEKLIKESPDTVQKKSEGDSLSVTTLGANYLLVHLLGYVCMNSPMVFTRIGASYGLLNEDSLFYGLIATSLVLVILAPLLLRAVRRGRVTHEELSLVNILLLTELATVCLAVGMHNFPLGLTIALFYTPLALVAGVVTKTKGKRAALSLAAKRLLCLVLQPLCALTLAMVLYSGGLFPEEGVRGAVRRGGDAASLGIMFAVTDSLVYGNWLFNLVTSTVLPMWLIFWQLLCTPVQP